MAGFLISPTIIRKTGTSVLCTSNIGNFLLTWFGINIKVRKAQFLHPSPLYDDITPPLFNPHTKR